MFMSVASIISLAVGIISCTIGVATFVSAQITKARQDGVLIEKVNTCISNTEEIKKDIKEKNKEIDGIIDEHTRAITQLQTEMKTVLKHINLENVI